MHITFLQWNLPLNGVLSVTLRVDTVTTTLEATTQSLHTLGYQTSDMLPEDWIWLGAAHLSRYHPSEPVPRISLGNCEGLPGPRRWIISGHDIHIVGDALPVDGIRYTRGQVNIRPPRTSPFTATTTPLMAPPDDVLEVDGIEVALPRMYPVALECQEALHEWLTEGQP